MPLGKMYRHTKGRGLNMKQRSQVKKAINSSKQFKICYVPVAEPFTNITGATPFQTNFMEVTAVPYTSGESTQARDASVIELKSYNLKFGISYYLDDQPVPVSQLVTVPFRIIIAKSRTGAITDIVDNAGVPVADFISQPDNDKVQVLHDEIISLSGQPPNNIAPGYHMKFFKKFGKGINKYMLVRYESNDVAGIAIENGIYMKTIVDSLTPTNSYNFLLSGFFKVKFYEHD